jgi:nucleoside-diphosphate-sugar epimerase
MSRVLVTGATGFIGRHVVTGLVGSGHDVHAISRRTGTDDRVAWHTADLHDRAEVHRIVSEVAPERAVHLAWDVTAGFASAIENLDWVATSLTLTRELADVGCRRLVLAGTCFEYDWSDGVCHEDTTPTRPTTLYGASKLAVTSTTVAAASELGMEVAVGRVFFLFGPGEPQNKLVAHVVRSLLRGERAACTAGEQRRDYSYVEDVADGLVRLVDSSVAGVVNVARGEAVRVADLIGMIGEATGRPELLGLGDRPTSPDQPPLIVADVTRLRAELGTPEPTPLAEAVRRTVRWWDAAGG